MDQKYAVVADPHVVYYDAVRTSPWTTSEHTLLPNSNDWSTHRYAVKDIILGVVTHRYNRQKRRLEIRAYFVGEHPIFKEFEPTRVMFTVLCSQAYQSGGSMELFFEQGIPFDIRQLIELKLNQHLSGHEQKIPGNLTKELYGILSDFPISTLKQIESQVPLELVCFNTYRGTWTANHLKSLIRRGISLRTIFMSRPDPLRQPIEYLYLVNHLRAVMLEEYALHQLSDRRLGISVGKRIDRIDEKDGALYTSPYSIEVDNANKGDLELDSYVKLMPNERFCIVPHVVTHSANSIAHNLGQDMTRAAARAAAGKVIIVLPLDFIYLPFEVRRQYFTQVLDADYFVLTIGLTMSQLLTEIEFNLAITAAQADEDEVEDFNVLRYAD
ncbi:MAG: hypothetical protein R2932_19620 [Caldilineaceae bacterium]